MSNSDNTTNDLRVATMLLQKLGETFQDLQSRSFSIITLAEQWKSLQYSIGKLHSSVEEKVKAVESKDGEINMNRIRLQNFKKDVENRLKNLEIRENSLKQRIEDVELREKQIKEWCEIFELQKREIAEISKAVKVCEKRNSDGLERVKAVDAEEVRVSARRKAVEERENVVDVRRKAVEERENEVSERRKAVEDRENVVEERRKAVEERENVVEERWKAVEERENEVDAKEKEAKAAAEKVGLREGMMKERGDELEAKEVKLKEFEEEVNRRFVVLEEKEEELGLTEKEIDELYSAVRLKEEENDERSKMLEKKEKEIDERYQVLEGKELELELIEKEKDELFNDVRLKEKEINEMREKYLKEVELWENALNERIKEVEMREEEVNVKIDAFEVKVAQIDGICKGMEVKRCRMAKMKEAMMEEVKVKVKEGGIEERQKVVEREKQMDDRCRELDCSEKMLNEGGEELTSSALAKTREPEPVACCEVQSLCRNMDTNGMRSYLIKLPCKEIYNMRDEISDSLQLSPDPAKLVFNVIQSFYELVGSESTLRQAYTACCTTLSGALLLLNTSITPHLKDDAMKFSIKWRDLFANQGYTHRLDKFAFLQFLATYELVQSYDADELFSHLGAFYTESEALLRRQGLYLCRILGLEKKVPGFIKSLISREEKLQAVVYICAFKLEDDFPPVPLLKGHLECIQKRVQEIVKKGSDNAQNDAVNMELTALRTLLKCISNFKLESSFSPAPLESRIKQLEREGVALPGFDQSHLAIGKKRTLNSMESRNQRKIFKVNVCRSSISKKPINLPATN